MRAAEPPERMLRIAGRTPGLQGAGPKSRDVATSSPGRFCSRNWTSRPESWGRALVLGAGLHNPGPVLF